MAFILTTGLMIIIGMLTVFLVVISIELRKLYRSIFPFLHLERVAVGDVIINTETKEKVKVISLNEAFLVATYSDGRTVWITYGGYTIELGDEESGYELYRYENKPVWKLLW